MKIFSLQSKTGLVVWSILTGLVLNYLIFFLTVADGSPAFGIPEAHYTGGGLPFTIQFNFFTLGGEMSFFDLFKNINFYLDWIVWSALALVILSLIRHFRNKKS